MKTSTKINKLKPFCMTKTAAAIADDPAKVMFCTEVQYERGYLYATDRHIMARTAQEADPTQNVYRRDIRNTLASFYDKPRYFVGTITSHQMIEAAARSISRKPDARKNFPFDCLCVLAGKPFDPRLIAKASKLGKDFQVYSAKHSNDVLLKTPGFEIVVMMIANVNDESMSDIVIEINKTGADETNE